MQLYRLARSALLSSMRGATWRRRKLRGRVAVALALSAVAAAPGSTASADQLELRDQATPIEGMTLAVTEEGVQFLPRRGEATWHTWDRVRSLDAESAEFEQAFEGRREFADRLWRARSRIERGDFALAEPLLESMVSDTIGRTDRAALVVMEGLLRCRLARGARAAAVVPWLETLRLVDSGVERTAYLAAPRVIDEATGLCAALPPVWATGPALDALIGELGRYAPGQPTHVAKLSQLYLIAARRASGETAQLDPLNAWISGNTEEGGEARAETVMIAWSMVRLLDEKSNTPAVSDRDEPIRRLDRALTGRAGFEAWRLFGRGAGMASTSDDERAREGIIELLKIPAWHGDADEYLAGFALVRAAERLDKMNRSAAASSLRRELSERFPNHPAAAGDSAASADSHRAGVNIAASAHVSASSKNGA